MSHAVTLDGARRDAAAAPALPRATAPHAGADIPWFSIPPSVTIHRAMQEGTAVLRRRLRHGAGAATRMLCPARPGHLLWLFAGYGDCHHGRIAGDALRFRPAPGTALLIPPGMASEWQVSGPGGDVVELHMAPGWLAGLAEAEALPAAAGRPLLRLLRADAQLVPLLRLFEIARAADGADAAFCGAWAVLVGQRLLRLPPGQPATGGHAMAPHRLAAVKAHVAANLAAEIHLDELAALAGLSPAHFSRAFRQQTGLSPYAWLIAQRVAAAMRLLAETDWPIARVAREAGFGTAAHFSTRFRRDAGASPAQWRAARRD